MPEPATPALTVPVPCGEAWSAMTPAAGGRHCAACRKTVTDFSGWSDADLAAFLAQPVRPAGCGRFRTDQLDRPLAVPHQPHSLLYRWVAVVGLAVITLALAPAPVRAQGVRPQPQSDTACRTAGSTTARFVLPGADTARQCLTAGEIERLPVRSVLTIVGLYAAPSVMPSTRTTYTGEQFDRMHLDHLTELLKGQPAP